MTVMRQDDSSSPVDPGPAGVGGEAVRASRPDGADGVGAKPDERAREAGLGDAVRAPMGQVSRAVREDVSRLRVLIRAIRTPYTVLGLVLHVATAALGTLVVFLGGFPDWPMHAGLHVVLLSLVLLYFRAGLRGFRVRRVLYCVFTTVMLLFFAWILVDLMPSRPEIVTGRDIFSDEGPPVVFQRPEAPLLGWIAGGLCAVALWLVVHMAMVRTRRMR